MDTPKKWPYLKGDTLAALPAIRLIFRPLARLGRRGAFAVPYGVWYEAETSGEMLGVIALKSGFCVFASLT